MADKSDRFTKIATELLIDVRELVRWGIDTGNTTPEKMRLTVAARKEAATKLVASGMSQRQAAKLLGVDKRTIGRDVGHNAPKCGAKSVTNSTATRARRALVRERACSGGVTAAPRKKYRVVYADPPWDYGAHLQPDYHTEQRDHYAVMSIDAICAEPVKTWVEDDAVLFLWVTSPILEKAFTVIRAWGFEYKTSFVWDKIKHNLGHYNSVRHEFLLVCTRGACRPDEKQLFDSVQSIERTRHGAKPVEFYDIIETLYVRGDRLEMYGRKRRSGWDVHGHVAQLEAAE